MTTVPEGLTAALSDRLSPARLTTLMVVAGLSRLLEAKLKEGSH